MNFENFVEELIFIASNFKKNDGDIIKYIAYYLSDKALPHLDADVPIVARCSLILEDEPIEAQRCYYPPNTLLDKILLQRANYPKEQVFCCALPSGAEGDNAMFTAMIETINAKVKNEYINRIDMIISTWVCKRPLKLWVLPFSKASCEINPTFKKVRDGLIPIIGDIKPKNEEVIRVLQFFSDAFWRENNLDVYYRITTAYYHALRFYEMQKKENFDGLMYPSCHTKGKGINVVLKKEVVDNNIISLEKYEHGFGIRAKDNPKHIVCRQTNLDFLLETVF